MSDDKKTKKKTRTIKVGTLARVEGEGSLYIKIHQNKVKEVKLKIFEPPRFFEAFLRGRSYSEAPDLTARICGICPVAYMMSTVHAIENAFDVTIPPHIRELRRLLYCGEWIESHALHIFMLHAPDFLGFPDAMTMAKEHRSEVERGLRIKKIGNQIISLLGGREIHPINVKVGGFYRIPEKREFQKLVAELQWGRDASYEALQWVSEFTYPQFNPDYELVSIVHPAEYPFNEGRIVSNKGVNIECHDYEGNFIEEHVAHSTALHSSRVGGEAYLTGPAARFNLNFNHLTPSVKKAADEFALTPPCQNPYRSIQIRLLEVMYAFEEAERIISSMSDGGDSSVSVQPRAGVGYAATEAPRGTLYHRFVLDKEGLIKEAKIVPPTSQNQKRIEADLAEVVSEQMQLPDQDLVHLCEQTIRNYDPCISCSAHFLDLRVERN